MWLTRNYHKTRTYKPYCLLVVSISALVINFKNKYEMIYKAKILGHEGFVVGTLESSAKDGFNDMIKDKFGKYEYIDVTTLEKIGIQFNFKRFLVGLSGAMLVSVMFIILNVFLKTFSELQIPQFFCGYVSCIGMYFFYTIYDNR